MTLVKSRYTFSVDGETIRGVSLRSSPDGTHHIFSLHGAGESNKERATYLLQELVERTLLSAFTFDFSGHGESSGKRQEQSLSKRYTQASYAIGHFGGNPLFIIGSSMGGDTALRMLERTSVRAVVLFAPAIYSDAAYMMPFDTRFTDTIRDTESWRYAAHTLDLLKTYTGRLLIFIGEKDVVVPQEVIDLIDTASEKVSRKEIVKLSGCDHSIHSFIEENEDVRSMVLSKILDFMTP